MGPPTKKAWKRKARPGLFRFWVTITVAVPLHEAALTELVGQASESSLLRKPQIGRQVRPADLDGRARRIRHIFPKIDPHVLEVRRF